MIADFVCTNKGRPAQNHGPALQLSHRPVSRLPRGGVVGRWLFLGAAVPEEFGNLPVTTTRDNRWRGEGLGAACFQVKVSNKP
jgi:hypothetical protein